MAETAAGTSAEQLSPRTRFLRWLRRSALLSAFGIVGWFAWGAVEAAWFRSRIDELRASGAMPTPESIRVSPGPPEENGYALLRDAQAKAYTRAIELRTQARMKGFKPGNGLVPYEQWSPPQLDHLGRMLEAMAGLTAAIDEALARPKIIAFSKEGGGENASMVAVWVLRTCRETAAVHPDRRAAQVGRMLRFMDHWQTQPGVLSGRVALWQSMVLPELAHLLASEQGEATLPQAWSALLAEEEARFLAMPSAMQAFERTTLCQLLEGWQRGQDPMKERRELFASVRGHIRDTKLDGDAEEFRDQLDGTLRSLRDGILQQPPHQEWWAWPLLQHTTRDLACQLPDEPIRPWTTRRLREAAFGDPMGESDADMVRHAQAILQRMAALRAARAALAVRAALMSHEGDASDVEALRAAIEVRDALSDGQFILTREANSMVVALPESAMHDVLRGALGEDPHSRWRVRIP